MVLFMSKNVVLVNALTALISVVVCLIGFYLVESRNYLTRPEATELIRNSYLVIKNELSHSKHTDAELSELIKHNTEAIREIQVQIGQLFILAQQNNNED